jgi:GAF domain-containing protein
LLLPKAGSPVADSPITRSIAVLTRFFVGDGTVEDTLHKVSELTLEAIGPAEMVGITMLVEGDKRTAVFTDAEAPEIDQAQYDADDGPCVSAFREGVVTEIRDTTEPGEWMEFRRTAAAHGIASTLSLPMLVDKAAVGAMNLYARTPHAFGPSDQADGEAFASQAAIVLANAQAYWDAHTLSLRLGEAMQSRAVIDQAKGILMAAQRVSEDDAFDLLVRASQRENTKLRDVARRIVDGAVARGRPDGLGG